MFSSRWMRGTRGRHSGLTQRRRSNEPDEIDVMMEDILTPPGQDKKRPASSKESMGLTQKPLYSLEKTMDEQLDDILGTKKEEEPIRKTISEPDFLKTPEKDVDISKLSPTTLTEKLGNYTSAELYKLYDKIEVEDKSSIDVSDIPAGGEDIDSFTTGSIELQSAEQLRKTLQEDMTSVPSLTDLLAHNSGTSTETSSMSTSDDLMNTLTTASEVMTRKKMKTEHAALLGTTTDEMLLLKTYGVDNDDDDETETESLSSKFFPKDSDVTIEPLTNSVIGTGTMDTLKPILGETMPVCTKEETKIEALEPKNDGVIEPISTVDESIVTDLRAHVTAAEERAEQMEEDKNGLEFLVSNLKKEMEELKKKNREAEHNLSIATKVPETEEDMVPAVLLEEAEKKNAEVLDSLNQELNTAKSEAMEWKRKCDENEVSKADYDLIDKENVDLKATLERERESNAEDKMLYEEQSKELQEYTLLVDGLKGEIEELRRIISNKDTEIKNMQIEDMTIDMKNKSLEKRVKELDGLRADFGQENHRLEEDIIEKQKIIQKLKKRNFDLDSKMKALISKEELGTINQNHRAEMTTVQGALKNFQEKYYALRRKYLQEKKQADTYENEIITLRNSLKMYQEDSKKSAEMLRILKGKLSETKVNTRIYDLEKTLSDMSSQNQALHKRIHDEDNLRSRISFLEEELQSKAKEKLEIITDYEDRLQEIRKSAEETNIRFTQRDLEKKEMSTLQHFRDIEDLQKKHAVFVTESEHRFKVLNVQIQTLKIENAKINGLYNDLLNENESLKQGFLPDEAKQWNIALIKQKVLKIESELIKKEKLIRDLRDQLKNKNEEVLVIQSAFEEQMKGFDTLRMSVMSFISQQQQKEKLVTVPSTDNIIPTRTHRFGPRT
ncbi:hypothetical protein PCE1_003010 [Barthelona sp. PCE]